MTRLSFKILMWNYFINAFIPLITTVAGAIRYGLTAVEVSALNGYLTDWNLKFAAYVNPLTNGPVTIDAINMAYKTGYPLVSSTRISIKDNTTIVLTSEEKRIMQIKDSSGHGGFLPVPNKAPVLACIAKEPLMLHFVALNPALPFKRAKPNGVDAIGIKTAIVREGEPAPPLSAYERQDDETETTFEMLFTADQVGKILFIIGFYLNPRGEAGQDGFTFSVKIM